MIAVFKDMGVQMDRAEAAKLFNRYLIISKFFKILPSLNKFIEWIKTGVYTFRMTNGEISSFLHQAICTEF